MKTSLSSASPATCQCSVDRPYLEKVLLRRLHMTGSCNKTRPSVPTPQVNPENCFAVGRRSAAAGVSHLWGLGRRSDVLGDGGGAYHLHDGIIGRGTGRPWVEQLWHGGEGLRRQACTFHKEHSVQGDRCPPHSARQPCHRVGPHRAPPPTANL